MKSDHRIFILLAIVMVMLLFVLPIINSRAQAHNLTPAGDPAMLLRYGTSRSTQTGDQNVTDPTPTPTPIPPQTTPANMPIVIPAVVIVVIILGAWLVISLRRPYDER